MMNAANAYLIAGMVQGRWGSAHETVVPYQAFRARDGYLIIGVGNERLWKTFCDAIGAPEWADDPRFDSNARRVERREDLVRLIEARLAAKSRDEWIREFSAAGLPTGPINTVDQTFADPQVLHRGMVQEIEHPTAGRVRLVGIPVKFSDSPGAITEPPPLLGQHTAEVLGKLLGVSAAEIEDLKREGVV